MAVRKHGRKSVQKCKRTIVLSADAAARLDAHALGSHQPASRVVEALILAHCRRWVLSDRGDPAAAGQGGGEGEKAA
jgi:hypothetical protein